MYFISRKLDERKYITLISSYLEHMKVFNADLYIGSLQTCQTSFCKKEVPLTQSADGLESQ